jgi:short-subunit dehydrogenase
MNIIIVGCGNVGFETSKLLSKEHKLMIVDICQHQYITDFIKDNKNVTFMQADATNAAQMENAIKCFTDQHHTVDALISTTGALVPGTPAEEFDLFKRNFELNFFGNLVPIKYVIGNMIAAKAGRLIILSSTTGHFSPRSLAAYSSAKWALESLSTALRSELQPYGITVDVISPASIKNRYSKVFTDTYNTVDPSRIASMIEGLLRKPDNSNHFIPGRYRLYHLAERLAPYVLDRWQGVKPRMERERRSRNVVIDNVMILGASTAIGKKLAYMNAKTAKKLYLVDRDLDSLLELKKQIGAISDCDVDIGAPDMADTRSIKEYADGISRVDLFINVSRQSQLGAVNDIPLDLYRRNFDTYFFGVLYLFAELFKKENKPKKLINILSSIVIAGRRNHSSYACTMAAFWSFTRAMRRAYGDELQVVEVLCPGGTPDARSLKTGDANTALFPAESTDDTLAQKIQNTAKKGKEIVFPAKVRLLLALEALTPGVYNKMYT